jgi:hypothetical protein
MGTQCHLHSLKCGQSSPNCLLRATVSQRLCQPGGGFCSSCSVQSQPAVAYCPCCGSQNGNSCCWPTSQQGEGQPFDGFARHAEGRAGSSSPAFHLSKVLILSRMMGLLMRVMRLLVIASFTRSFRVVSSISWAAIMNCMHQERRCCKLMHPLVRPMCCLPGIQPRIANNKVMGAVRVHQHVSCAVWNSV